MKVRKILHWSERYEQVAKSFAQIAAFVEGDSTAAVMMRNSVDAFGVKFLRARAFGSGGRVNDGNVKRRVNEWMFMADELLDESGGKQRQRNAVFSAITAMELARENFLL